MPPTPRPATAGLTALDGVIRVVSLLTPGAIRVNLSIKLDLFIHSFSRDLQRIVLNVQGPDVADRSRSPLSAGFYL